MVTATVLVPGGASQFHSLCFGDDDWFSLNMQSGMQYRINLNMYDYDFGFAFFNAAGEPLNDTDGISIDMFNYYMQVSVISNAALYFRLQHWQFIEYEISVAAQAVQ